LFLFPRHIWSRVTEVALRWEIVALFNEEGNEGNNAPQLESAVVEGEVGTESARS
jgi:hypothetical protein